MPPPARACAARNAPGRTSASVTLKSGSAARSAAITDPTIPAPNTIAVGMIVPLTQKPTVCAGDSVMPMIVLDRHNRHTRLALDDQRKRNRFAEWADWLVANSSRMHGAGAAWLAHLSIFVCRAVHFR